MKRKILLIEDDNGSRLGMVSSLSRKGYAVSVENNLANAEADVLAGRFDAVILGMSRAGGSGSGFIKGVRAYDGCLPIVVITGDGDIETAVDAVRCGADSVLARPVDFAAFSAALQLLLEVGPPKAPPRKVSRRRKGAPENFFGPGPAAGKFFDQAAQAAEGDAPVLISGETGTGKGLLARWMHQNGSRSQLPFTTVNCSGLRGDLLAAELFGSAPRGGAGSPGVLDRAGSGTLLLDEIGDMDLAVQAGLLARLQARSAQVGGEENSGGFRLICASNQQLDALARAGYFLPELLALITATVLRVPPLRERLTELPGIVRHLLERLAGPEARISGQALRVLKGYCWPGNLRELKNALEQGLLLSHGRELLPEHFNWLKPAGRAKGARPLTLSETKERHIAAVLEVAGGDVGAVAAGLGISRATMYRRLQELRGKNY